MTLIINDMPNQAPPELIDKLLKMETASAGHFVDIGFFDAGLRPVVPVQRAAGTAVTIAIPDRTSTLLHYLLGLVRPGDFIVIDRLGDCEHACVGGGIAVAAKVAGVAGIVVDGPCTDEDQIREFGMPVWCRGVTAMTTGVHRVAGAINTVVSCGGVSVGPGDVVVADANGILVLPANSAAAIAEAALARQAREPAALKLLLEGKKIGVLSGATAKVEKALDHSDQR